MLVLATLFWGLSFPLMKAIVLVHGQVWPGSPGWFVTAMTVAPRFLFATAILAVWRLRPGWRATALEWKQGVVIGLFAAAGMLLQSDGLQYTAASTSAFLTQFYAILIPVYLAVRSRLNPGRYVWIACALVLAGVAVLGHFNWRDLALGRGEAETLLASFFFMGQILWLERPEFANNRADRITLIMFATQGVLFGGMALGTAPAWEAIWSVAQSPSWLGYTLALTVVCTIGAYSIMNTWQPRITSTEAGLIYCVEPIFGSVMALFLPAIFSVWSAIHYPNETMTTHLLLGGGLITAANLVIQLRPPAKVA